VQAPILVCQTYPVKAGVDIEL